MPFSFSSISLRLFVTTLFIITIATTHAVVPPNATFKYVNEGELGEYVTEYDATYRALDIGTFPFQLCFYNATTNLFTLGIRMGHRRSVSNMRWVWDANRGKPVGDMATLTFGADGNLFLADADGTVAWQTGTANKGVVGLNLLGNGNLVLYDKKGKFLWQSFDHPSDTLLVGQSLRSSGPTKLVSRFNDFSALDGTYSYVLEKKNLALYHKPADKERPMIYYKGEDFVNGDNGYLESIEFHVEPVEGFNGGFAFDLSLVGTVKDSEFDSGNRILSRPKYNATYSMLRIDMDGNLRVYTYDENVDWGAWEVTFTLFDRKGQESECQLPLRCGGLGVCENNQCVACPTPEGLSGWSSFCSAGGLFCRPGANVTYYKVVGVDHFMSAYNQGEGPMKLNECRKRCSADCKCWGFFYREDSSKCLMVPAIDTMTASISSNVAYIKISK